MFSRVAMLNAGVPLVKLFGPEHGLDASAADGARVDDNTDAATGLPVISLYGERMRPSAESLTDLDAVLFDIPDIGARFYTYTWTLYQVLAACEEAHVPLVVLDRPNPLGGDVASAEGPLLHANCRSFIGEHNIPIRHQLTSGELARLFQRECFPRSTVQIIPCESWTRQQDWSSLQLPWIPTSPSMPSFASAACYPGMCLFEATNLSVGRGTDTPFQLVGAPWLDARAVIAEMQRRFPNDPHARSLSASNFTPLLSPFAGEACQGIRVGRFSTYEIVSFGFRLLVCVAATHAEQFAWSRYPTAANPGGDEHFARLVGQRGLDAFITANASTIDNERIAEWTTSGNWTERVRSVLLYS